MSCKYTYKNKIYTREEFISKVITPEFINQPKARRVIELQSDLFQKSRDNKKLTNTDLFVNNTHSKFNRMTNKREITEDFTVGSINYSSDLESVYYEEENQYEEELVYRKNGQKISFLEFKEAKLKIIQEFHTVDFLRQEDAIKGNQFLQLLNKKGNWISFFIQSIIQDSAKKGYEKVLFPSGETAARIEGHQTIADEIKKINDEIEFWKNAKPTINEVYKTHGEEMWTITYNGIIKGNFNTKEEAQKHIDNIDFNKLEKQKQELKTQGLEKLKPIEAFYENRVQNILNKLYGKDNVNRITDEFGNEWFEIDLKNITSETILLNEPEFLSSNITNNELRDSFNKLFVETGTTPVTKSQVFKRE